MSTGKYRTVNCIRDLQGGVQVPTGGKVRDLPLQSNRCDSGTNSTVWMKEDAQGVVSEGHTYNSKEL